MRMGPTPGAVFAAWALFLGANLPQPAPAAEPPGYVRPPIVLDLPAASGNGWRLRWTAPGTGWRFTVESRDRFGPGPWSPIGEVTDGVGVGREWVDAGPSDGQRWYRVAATAPETARGEVVEARLVTTFSRLLIGAILDAQGLEIIPRYDVRFYRVLYRTVDPYGLPATASGALALPAGAVPAAPLASYQHGTILRRTDVPSAANTESLVGLAFATDGYAAAMPDYLGLGASGGLHPYHLARSEATAVVDLLRAARTVAGREGVALDGRVFLLGYSQGGHATAAAHRELEARHAGEFTVTASAPMAGAFDLSGTALTDGLSDRVPPNPYYLAYLLAAYVEYYRFAPSLAAILRPPYSAQVPPLLDGNADGTAVNDVLPARGRDALDPAFLAALESDPDHPLRLALRENDLLDWAPRAPVRVLHCAGDLDVLPAHSAIAVARWRAAGAASVEFLDPSPASGHGGCAVPALFAAKAWFDSLRTAPPGAGTGGGSF